jgi:hypothetical protein
MTDSPSDYAPPLLNSMHFYRGGHPVSKVAATICSCGLGGFNCATGGEQPQVYVRCCRVDVHEAVVLPCMVCTCCCCCCAWPWWAALLHRALNVDFYRLAWFRL